MAYIGNQNYQAYVTLNNQTFTTSGSTTIYALNYTVTNANNLDLYIGGSKQQPGVAYTAAGNTLTLTTATSSSMYAVYLGQGIQTTNLPVGVVTTSNLVSGFNLPATQGGTGTTTYTAGNILYASNATTLTTLAPGTSGYGLTLNGTTPTWASVGGKFESALLHVRDEKATTTNGGTFTSGAWQTRTLNTVMTNEISGASLASNQITLPSGTYYINAVAVCLTVSNHKLKLRNITDSSDVLIGLTNYADPTGSVGNNAHVTGRFTIASSKVFEIQHRSSSTTNINGFGTNAGFSTVEVYADTQIWKVA
jgi:hypothetical protein